MAQDRDTGTGTQGHDGQGHDHHPTTPRQDHTYDSPDVNLYWGVYIYTQSTISSW